MCTARATNSRYEATSCGTVSVYRSVILSGSSALQCVVRPVPLPAAAFGAAPLLLAGFIFHRFAPAMAIGAEGRGREGHLGALRLFLFREGEGLFAFFAFQYEIGQ